MPSFWGCRCCRRSTIVLAADGHFRFVNGMTGSQLGEWSHASAMHAKPLKWLNRSRFVHVRYDSGGFGQPTGIYGTKNELEFEKVMSYGSNGEYSPLQGYDVLPDGTHIIFRGIGREWATGPQVMTICDIDGNDLYTCPLPAGDGDVGYVAALFCGDKPALKMLDGLGDTFTVFDTDGTVLYEWAPPFPNRYSEWQTGTADGMIFANIDRRPMGGDPGSVGKTDLEGNIVWQNDEVDYPRYVMFDAAGLLVAVSINVVEPVSGYFEFGTDYTVYRLDPDTGETLESYVMDIVNPRSFGPDPYDPDVIFLLHDNDALAKYDFVSGEFRWQQHQNASAPYYASLAVRRG